MRHNQMVFGIHCRLHIVADHAGTTATRGHGTGVWIRQGDLLVRCLKQPDLELF
jgi:hypothetical protein